MTDMSFSSFEAADEFGGLDHLVPPGQDPAVLRRYYADFMAELQPGNFIERLWARDLAIQTAHADYLRLAGCEAIRFVQDSASAKSEASSDAAPPSETPAAAQLGSNEPASSAEPGASAEPISAAQPPTENKLGKAFSEHTSMFSSITSLVLMVLQARDALISRYDARSDTLRALRAAFEELMEIKGEPDADAD